jgi:hypothetical protein
MSQPIVTFSLMRFESITQKWWAFAQMGKSRSTLGAIKGLQFYKMVGSGAGNGFSILPNFGVYGLIAVWDSEAYAQSFFQEDLSFQPFKENSIECCHFYCKTATSHGAWDGANPFIVTTPLMEQLPVAVLTRATIKWRYLAYFWKFVPRTSRSIYAQNGRLFSIGIGELPLIQQATFSLWENPKKMMDFAYKSKFHSEVVQKTRQLGWYKEELFARFHPFRMEGTWQGLSSFLPERDILNK